MVGTRRMSRAELDRETCSMRWRRITLFWLRRPWVFSSCLFAAMLGFGGLVLSELEYRVNLDQREATDRFVERMNATLSPSDFAELVDRLGVNLKQVEDDLALIASEILAYALRQIGIAKRMYSVVNHLPATVCGV